jgi:hypothetical protein
MRSGHDLHQLQPSYPDDENLDDNQELVEDFEGVTEAVANITQDEEVMNNVFFSP